MTGADYLSTSLPVLRVNSESSEWIREGCVHKGGDIRRRFRSYPYHPAA
jgi:hypothetical protein